MVTASGRPGWLTILSIVIFVVVFTIAVRMMWRAWMPEFRDQYGEVRGRRFLALFVASFSAFVAAHVLSRNRRDHRPPQGDTD